MDISHIESCRLLDLDLGPFERAFPGPKYGCGGIKARLGIKKRPLIGAIIKPKIGLKTKYLVDICKAMADGGADFIKEDEILSNQEFSPFKERVRAIAGVLKNYKTYYVPCVTSDWPLRDIFYAESVGANACHINVWSGLGMYHAVRKSSTRCAIFFQKSGDKVITTGQFSVDFKVICKLVHLAGCDFGHVGMSGGYLSESDDELRARIGALQTTIPSFSCGAMPHHVEELAEKFGSDIMITSGGYVNGHEKGVEYAVKEFRQRADRLEA